MKIKDSCLIKEAVAGEDGRKLRSAASQYGTRNKIKFSIRKAKNGYRLWRIA